MKKIIVVALSATLLSGCAAAVDFGLVSGSISALEPLVNNNPNAKSRIIDNRPRCSYVKSVNLIVVDVCPQGIPAGTYIYK